MLTISIDEYEYWFDTKARQWMGANEDMVTVLNTIIPEKLYFKVFDAERNDITGKDISDKDIEKLFLKAVKKAYPETNSDKQVGKSVTGLGYVRDSAITINEPIPFLYPSIF